MSLPRGKTLKSHPIDIVLRGLRLVLGLALFAAALRLHASPITVVDSVAISVGISTRKSRSTRRC